MFDAEREMAQELAREAGAAVLALYEAGTSVSYKTHHEPVTEADLASNRVIMAGLRRHFPDDPVLSEESADDSQRLRYERVWIVDPLDGTQEFVDRVGQFAVMIGLAVAGRPVLGAVYQPVGDRLWLASAGWGAVLVEGGETRRLSVSRRTSEDGLRLVVTRSHDFAGMDEIRAALGISEVRRVGSVGLKMGAIAADEADLYVHISNRTKEWDTCAPEAVLQEAGGRITDLLGEPLRYNKPEVPNEMGIMATNGPPHARVLEFVKPWLAVAGLGGDRRG